jgi:hypothetical protein
VAIEAPYPSFNLFWWAEPLLYVVSFVTEVPGIKCADWRTRCSANVHRSGRPEQPSGKYRRSESTPEVLIGEAVDNGIHCGIHGDQIMADEPQGAVAVHDLKANVFHYESSP